MNREEFLETLQYFDYNYNVITMGDSDFNKRLDTLGRGEPKDRYTPIFNRVEITKVKGITLAHNNCFTPFYNLDKTFLKLLFCELSKIELGLTYFYDFSDKYKDIQKSSKDRSKQNKINEVIGMLGEVGSNYDTTIANLEGLRESIDNSHFTKRQLFQDLLRVVALLLNNNNQSRKVANVTNKLIEDYFDEDISFSRGENINKYELFTYYYTSKKGLSLWHSKRVAE